MGLLMIQLVFKVEVFGRSIVFVWGSVPDDAKKVVDLTGVVLTAGITIKVLGA